MYYNKAVHEWSTTRPRRVYTSPDCVISWYHPKLPSQREESSHWRWMSTRSVQSGPLSWLTVHPLLMDQQISIPEFSRNVGLVHSELLHDYTLCKTTKPSLKRPLSVMTKKFIYPYKTNKWMKQCNNKHKWPLEKIMQNCHPHSHRVDPYSKMV